MSSPAAKVKRPAPPAWRKITLNTPTGASWVAFKNSNCVPPTVGGVWTNKDGIFFACLADGIALKVDSLQEGKEWVRDEVLKAAEEAEAKEATRKATAIAAAKAVHSTNQQPTLEV